MDSGYSTALRRRQVIQLTGISAAGITPFSRPARAQESNADVLVLFTEQESDGESIVIDSLKTNVEAELLIFESKGDRTLYKRMYLSAGTEFSNRKIDLDEPIPETQLVSISVQPPEGSTSYGGARETVTVVGSASDPADESTAGPAFGTAPGAQRIDADPEAGFHSPYFLFTPDTPDAATKSVNNSTERPLLVEVYPWGDFENRISHAREQIQNGTVRAERMNCPALIAPLPFKIEDAFLRLDDPAPREQRVDLQLVAMIEDAKSRLEGGAYTIAEQVHCNGGSTAGVFIDTFAALHPEHVNVFSSGANGIAFLPFAELTDDIPTFGSPEQTTVPWPIGAGEIDQLADKEFNRDAWMQIEQFRWIGAEDQDPENSDRYIHKIYKGSDEVDELVEEIFGTFQVDHRFETSREIYDHLGVPATFTAFEGAGHQPKSEQYNRIMEFHKKKIAEYFELIHLIPQSPTGESKVGDTVTVPVTAENHTGVASATTATLAVDGTDVDTTTIEVGPFKRETVELETTLENTGEFTLSVNGTAIGNPVVVSEERTETVSDDSSTDQTASSEQSTGEVEETSTGTEGPGFSVTQSLTALGGLGYLLKRQLSDSD